MLFGFDIPVFVVLFAAMAALFVASVLYKWMRGVDDSGSDEGPPPV